MAEPVLPPFSARSSDGLWHSRSPRIPFIEPWPRGHEPWPRGHEPVAPDVAKSFVLEFSTGEVVTVVGSGLIGRAPQNTRGDTTLQLVSVDDPARSVSKVHVRFEVDAEGLWIEDCDSGNGTAIVPPGRPALPIAPGQRHPAALGAVVRMGRQSFIVR
ncbi:FHA domain-containing protein [Agreia sp.]|uniref:FHA domain-containing protein n=1 Tax=Agreia sp. TaxID=1872416 RepID=UPI0035BBD304